VHNSACGDADACHSGALLLPLLLLPLLLLPLLLLLLS
jgi:hypothetical protein